MALRILFEGTQAVGVEITRGGSVEEIRAGREVILSAGAYQSPVLLMLSGIGPAADLELFGLQVRENLPVGENLQDHLMTQLNYETAEPSLFGVFTPESFERFETEGRGPLTSNIPEAGGFYRSRPELEAPDIEFHYSPSMFYDQGLTAPHAGGFCFGPVVVKPSSRGWVKLRTPLPDSKPRVLCNFLATEDDRQAVIAGIRMALEVAAQAPIRNAVSKAFSVPAGDSDDQILEFVREAGQTRLPRDLDVRDRRRRRPTASRLRHRRPPGRGRLRDADDHAGQHERGDDHDRREGSGADPELRSALTHRVHRTRGAVT